jgi:hypothetical protein
VSGVPGTVVDSTVFLLPGNSTAPNKTIQMHAA